MDIQIRSRLAINMAIMLQKKSTNFVGEHSVLPLLIQTNSPINQNLIDAFSFEQVAPKEKALQKEKGVFCAHAARRHYAWSATFEKVDETAPLVRANKVRNRSTNQNLKQK